MNLRRTATCLYLAPLLALGGVSCLHAGAIPYIVPPETPQTFSPTRPSSIAAPSILVSIPKYELSDADRQTIAACLILEAASQGDFGMRAVMSVIRNRARELPELFVPTVMKGKQFSALNSVTSGRESLRRLVARAQRDRMWPVALRIVDEAAGPKWHDPTGGATHYTRTGERTTWTRSLARTTTIGRHAFYR
ncbi:cell wall hydrolase [Opitutus sp. ER46]|uniref:cell wall hydrolase n=1 Tax=Opitutus sp. ER46 TaxID=2161864 RepID=UPI000D321AA7|nr:cell wall hydrolase [Opitutus sp. ER46]